MPAIQPQAYEIFAREFVARGARRTHAPEAAAAAGYPGGAVNGPYLLLNRPEVKEAIQRELALRFGELEITAKRTFEEIGRIAFSDPAELFDENGSLLPLHRMTPHQRAAISSMDFETTFRGRGDDATPVTTVKIRLWDKTSMLKLLGQHFKIIHDDKDGLNALAGELANQLRAGRERAQAARRSPAQPAQPAEVVEEARIIAAVNSLPQPAALAAQEIEDEERIW